MEERPRTPPRPAEREFGWGERRHHESAGWPPPPPPPEDDLYAGAGRESGTPPPPPPIGSGPDFSALFVLLDVVRRAAPAELQERINALIREALLTLRSLIDWYIERLERRPRETRVQDIPID